MDMIIHEAEGMYPITESESALLQQEIETVPVSVSEKNRHSPVAAENDVVETPGKMNTWFSCHVENILMLLDLSTWRPDPFSSLPSSKTRPLIFGDNSLQGFLDRQTVVCFGIGSKSL